MGFKFQLGKCCGCGVTPIDFDNPPSCKSSDCEPGVSISLPRNSSAGLSAQEFADAGMPCNLMLTYDSSNSPQSYSNLSDFYTPEEIPDNLKRKDGTIRPINFNFPVESKKNLTANGVPVFGMGVDYTDNYVNLPFVVNPVAFWNYHSFGKDNNTGEYQVHGSLTTKVFHVDHFQTKNSVSDSELHSVTGQTLLSKITNSSTNITSIRQCIKPKLERTNVHDAYGSNRTTTLLTNPYLQPKMIMLINYHEESPTVDYSIKDGWSPDVHITFPTNNVRFGRNIRGYCISGIEKAHFMTLPNISLANKKFTNTLSFADHLNIQFGIPFFSASPVSQGDAKSIIHGYEHLVPYREENVPIKESKVSFKIGVYAIEYYYDKTTKSYVKNENPVHIATLEYEEEDLVQYEYSFNVVVSVSIPTWEIFLSSLYSAAVDNIIIDLSSQKFSCNFCSYVNNSFKNPNFDFQRQTTAYFNLKENKAKVKIQPFTTSKPPKVTLRGPALKSTTLKEILASTTAQFTGNNTILGGTTKENEAEGKVGFSGVSRLISVIVSGDDTEHYFEKDAQGYYTLIPSKTEDSSEEDPSQKPTDSSDPKTDTSANQQTQSASSDNSSQNNPSSSSSETPNTDPSQNNDGDKDPDDQHDKEKEEEEEEKNPSYFLLAFGSHVQSEIAYYDGDNRPVFTSNNLITTDNSITKHVTANFTFIPSSDTMPEINEDAIFEAVATTLKENPIEADVHFTRQAYNFRVQFVAYYFDKAMTRTNGNETYDIPLG